MAKKVKIYNSLTRKKEDLTPLEENHIRMYACGVTTYDDNHIGHAMQAVFFDLIRSYLEVAGYKVTYVRNYTDVDDKIIHRAEKLSISPQKLASDLIAESEKEMAAIGVRSATHEPRVSQSIPDIIKMIETLISNQMAYPTDEGDVYYRVRNKKDYGKLSNRTPDDLRSGTRDLNAGQKEDQLDFALWKADKTTDASWQSPWGQGRPGWHIECSAMAKKFLGNHFDIHGGGLDLIFPHHENEIAQSEGANQCAYANTWMHSGLLTINKQKMSKSLGNSITIKQFLNEWPAEVLRLGYLQNHYRSNIDFSEEVFKNCRKKLLYLYQTLENAQQWPQPEPQSSQTKHTVDLDRIESDFHKHMSDDFNSPAAMAEVYSLARQLNHEMSQKRNLERKSTVQQGAELLLNLCHIFGLAQQNPTQFIEQLKTELVKDMGIKIEEIQEKIEKRKNARESKDWPTSDKIRDELLSMGISLNDGQESTTWTVASLID